MAATVVWLRQDLRIEDNPALAAAAERGGAVIPVYVWAPHEEGDWPPGAASRVWLHDSLDALARHLRARGSRLILRKGDSLDELRAVAEAVGANAVYWNRRYEPAARERDGRVEEQLRQDGYEIETYNASLLFEPWEIETNEGAPYKVFTPFWKACRKRGPETSEPVEAPEEMRPPEAWPESAELAALELDPDADWAGGLRAAWTPGESGARRQLEWFADEAMPAYDEGRDRPDQEGTSRLSPHLHFGEVSPRQVWHTIKTAVEEQGGKGGADAFLSEIGWREFAYHLLYHFPHTREAPLREQFRDFPWADDPSGLRAWQKGRTGYPYVDAGMRQLWRTGWMHNRGRMAAASFLTKDLLIPWQAGARWFWDTLVDADLANNTLGWQWTAGCGADAAPYFRIFNPTSQGKKHDPAGAYVRAWVPELAGLEGGAVHEPWKAGELLTSGYPAPIIDHSQARDRALEAFEQVKKG